MNIGQIIYTRRTELGLTMEQVGNYVGVGKSTVKKWENGSIANLKRDKIAKLSEILQLNPVVFINGDLGDSDNLATYASFNGGGEITEGMRAEIESYIEYKKNNPLPGGSGLPENLEKLDAELIKRLNSLSPDELARVDAFVQGLLANREA